jgi:hypothetical protein
MTASPDQADARRKVDYGESMDICMIPQSIDLHGRVRGAARRHRKGELCRRHSKYCNGKCHRSAVTRTVDLELRKIYNSFANCR